MAQLRLPTSPFAVNFRDRPRLNPSGEHFVDGFRSRRDSNDVFPHLSKRRRGHKPAQFGWIRKRFFARLQKLIHFRIGKPSHVQQVRLRVHDQRSHCVETGFFRFLQIRRGDAERLQRVDGHDARRGGPFFRPVGGHFQPSRVFIVHAVVLCLFIRVGGGG